MIVLNWFRVRRAQVSALLTKGSDSPRAIGCGGRLVVSTGVIDALLAAMAALALAMSLLRCCNSSVVGNDVLLFGGFSHW